ncbi:MAG: PAS domain-containing protein [Gammaproteobacteria bacterium]
MTDARAATMNARGVEPRPFDCGDLAIAGLELAEVGVWEVMPGDHPPRWSAAIYRFLGETPYAQPPASARFNCAIHPEDFAAVRHARRSGIRDRSSYAIVYRLCVGGSVRRVQERGTLRQGEHGECSQLRVVQEMISSFDCVHECVQAAPATPALNPAEDAVRRLAAIVRNSPHYIGYSDLEARIQFVNEAGLRMFGMPAEEVLGSHTQRFFGEPDRSYFEEFVLPFVMSHGSWTGDIRIRNQVTGADTLVHGTVFRIDDEITGEPLNLAAVAQDVTELRRAEAQLAAANTKLQTVLSSCPVVLWSADPSGMIRLAQGRDLTCGTESPETFIGTNVFERFAHDAQLIESFRKAQSGACAEAECEIGGRIFHQLMTPVLAADGAVSSITGVSVDITDSRRAQRELHQAYAVNRAIIAAIRDIVYVTDADFRLRWWNPRVEEIFELEGDALHGRHLLEFAEQSEVPRLQQALERVMREGAIAVEASVRLASGMVPHHHVLVRMHDENGMVMGVCGVARDATEQIRNRDELERLVESRTQELNAARLKAEAAANAKGEFLSRMSHELRTPLNAILGFAQLLISDVELPLAAEQREDMAFIESAGRHLLALINEVLDLSKFEREAHALDLGCVDLARELANCVALLRPIAQERGIRIELAAGSCEVRAEPTRLRQVLINLLSNAIKYNRPGGSVRLEWTESASARKRLMGPGIPADALPSLFEPFVRLVDEERSIEGTGMGLTVAKALIEQMGGAIGVESEYGSGSTFWIELPGPGPGETQTRSLRRETRAARNAVR